MGGHAPVNQPWLSFPEVDRVKPDRNPEAAKPPSAKRVVKLRPYRAQITEPPYTDPYVRWCDRESGRPPTYVDVCRACSTARRCKSSTQPDGGEELAKRKGVPVTEGLKEAWSKGASR